MNGGTLIRLLAVFCLAALFALLAALPVLAEFTAVMLHRLCEQDLP